MAPHEYKQYKQNKPIMEKICFIYITNSPKINVFFIYASTYGTNAPIYYITKAHLSHKKMNVRQVLAQLVRHQNIGYQYIN